MDITYIYLFIVGLFFGSFYNVVALRLTNNESIIYPGSHCVNCNHLLSWYELIPVFSYIGLRGKCRKCKKKISIQYPIVEIITGLLFMASYIVFGFTYLTLISIVLASMVIITILTDYKYMIILDEVLITGFIFLSILTIFSTSFLIYINHIISGLVIFGIMLIVKLLGDHAFKQESLGWGDVKLSFIAGFLLGIKLGIIYIFLGSFLAFPYALYTTYKKKDNILPFGPFLAMSILIIFWNMDYINHLINILLGR